MDLYNKLSSIDTLNLEYPFNQKIEDQIELTKNQVELYYIKQYNICVEKDKFIKNKEGGNNSQKSQIYVFSK